MKEKLCELAIEARLNAYAPISHYLVGAALLTKSGKIYTGCNIEDPSCIGVTNCCAERTAFIKAISEGEKDFEMIAVTGGKENSELILTTPCGVCRQYMTSFSPNILILCTDGKTISEYHLNELLSYAYSETFNK